MTFGIGGLVDPTHEPLAAPMRELRYGLHTPGVAAFLAKADLAGKVITFAPGLELADATKQLSPVPGKLPSALDVTIEQSIQAARFDKIVEFIAAKPAEQQPVSIHVLTDHGELGASTFLSAEPRRLQVGTPQSTENWTPVAIMALHASISDSQFLCDRVRDAIEANNYRSIGVALLRKYPALI